MALITMERPLTVSVPEAGKILGLKSRDAAYDAAHKGEIPVIRIGRLLRVPLVALERMLEQAGQPKKASA
jgi:excisionase family DNA binding protein